MRWLSVACAVALCAACGGRTEGGRTVSVSILPQRYFVERVAGDRVAVNVMVPPGSSPASMDLGTGQLEALYGSSIYFAVGRLPFELASVYPLLKEMPSVRLVRQADDREGDPHVWMSPRGARQMADSVFAVLSLSPFLADKFDNSVVAPIAFCTVLLLIGLINFVVFTFMDRKLDQQTGADQPAGGEEDQFKFSDIKYIFGSKMFWLIALLCVLYYSAIFPFQRYATNFLESTLNVTSGEAANLFRWFPILAMILTPVLGSFIDYKGKGASMLMYGALIMIICHLSYAFLLPAYPTKWFALLITVVLGVSFSLVPAALWPSVPKVIDGKILGSAYALIFWIQNIGLCFVPKIIGNVLNSTNPGVAEAREAAMAQGTVAPAYDYTVPMLIFASFGVLAFILGIWLKREDVVKGYGLELPNIKK